MKAYYIFQQADEETISNILDWMRNQERAIYRAAVREKTAPRIHPAQTSSGTIFLHQENAVMETQQ